MGLVLHYTAFIHNCIASSLVQYIINLPHARSKEDNYSLCESVFSLFVNTVWDVLLT